MNKHLGSCLCGEVRFEIVGNFERFFLCHCERCRKDTGSAHAANLFSSTAKVHWLSGQAKIKTFHVPGGLGVRVDTAAYAEGIIPPYYDSLIAKLITFGKDRPEAIMRMQRALEMFIVEGIHTTIPLHRRILRDEDFRAGNFDTKFVERLLAKLQEERDGEAAMTV